MNGMILIDKIKDGMPGITPIEGANLLENHTVLMQRMSYSSPKTYTMKGDNDGDVTLEWKCGYTEQMGRSYQDEESLTERSAVCVSVLLAKEYTGYSVVQRSWKGTGCDYFLGTEDNDLLNIKARLEISGIREETTSNTVDNRVRQKEEQLKKSDSWGVPGYVAVIEFSKLIAFFKKHSDE